MPGNESRNNLSDFIQKRAKEFSKVSVARLRAIEDLFTSVQSARADYTLKADLKAEKKHAAIQKS